MGVIEEELQLKQLGFKYKQKASSHSQFQSQVAFIPGIRCFTVTPPATPLLSGLRGLFVPPAADRTALSFLAQ